MATAFRAHSPFRSRLATWTQLVVETFFKTTKSELVWRTNFAPRMKGAKEIAQYIAWLYSPVG